MALNNDEARELRTNLEEILRRHQLSWVVDQAQERIALGNTVPKRVDQSALLFEHVGGRSGRSRKREAEFLTSQPLNEVESLEILLSAIEASLVDLPRMQQEMFATLGDETSAVQFSAEREEKLDTLERGDIQPPHTMSEHMKRILHDIREII